MKLNLQLLSFLTVALISTNVSAQDPNLNATDKSTISINSQSPSFESVLNRVRLLESISYRVGWTLEPGESYKLAQECLKYGTVENFRTMLKDENRIVRVMGLICLARSVSGEEFIEIAKPLFADNVQVKYTNGCVLNRSATVGMIARQLAEKRFFLTDEDKGAFK